MTWAQIAWLLSRQVGQVPNILSEFGKFTAAPIYLQKNVAFRGVSTSLDPLFTDLDELSVQTMSTVSELEAEQQLSKALEGAYGAQIGASGVLDRLKELKKWYDLLSPFLKILFPALPTLPFAKS